LGPLVEAHGLWLDASLAAPNVPAPFRQSDRLAVGFPTAGLAFDADPHRRVRLSGDVSGISAGRYGYAIESEVAVKVEVVRHLRLVGGFRAFRLRPKLAPDFAVIGLAGPFAGAAVRF